MQICDGPVYLVFLWSSRVLLQIHCRLLNPLARKPLPNIWLNPLHAFCGLSVHSLLNIPNRMRSSKRPNILTAPNTKKGSISASLHSCLCPHQKECSWPLSSNISPHPLLSLTYSYSCTKEEWLTVRLWVHYIKCLGIYWFLINT